MFNKKRRRTAAVQQPQSDIVVPGSAALPPVRVNAFRIGLVGGLGVLVSILIGGIIGQLTTVLIYVGVALFLALGLDPLVSWLERKLPRWAAILVVFAGVILAFAGLLLTIIPVIVEQVSNLIANFPDIVNRVVDSDFVKTTERQLSGVVDFDSVAKSVTDFVSDPNNFVNLGGGILAVGAGVASGVTGAVVVLILTLYFLASLRSIKRVTYRFVPASKRAGFIDVSEDITSAVGRYVVGQVSLAAVNGVLSAIFLWSIGAPQFVLLAFIAFLFSLVPLVGTLTGSIIIVLTCLFASPLTALVALIWYLVYMQIEAYFLSPRIMNRAVSVPGAVVVIAAVAGGTLGGILGALVAIPVAASTIIIIQKIVFPRQELK
ncbi:Predicted PurR-regulated permease PerM [Agreia bicolorata]|uniref:Predicted PurR-regulated permease PerM n=1 Tax=Agreia bicolorata TaxID=110935 RepID=A0A1T4XL29_9MICO|nr:AI-2E family transporter [Agreia bicolorata]SKA89858.1 Predicted PurR-regulated permease PerM [Agreia bicolorata]